MPQVDLNSSVASSVSNSIVEYSVNSEITDGADGTKEFTYQQHTQ